VDFVSDIARLLSFDSI